MSERPEVIDQVGAMLVAAGLGSARDHALISVLTLNGLRASEAIPADIKGLGLERSHRTLTILRKGGKVVTVPLAPRTSWPSVPPASPGQRPAYASMASRCCTPIAAESSAPATTSVGRRHSRSTP